MKEEEMLRKAEKLKFTNAAFLDVDQLEFDPGLRRYCRENACGNYGKNYACPPDCGTPEEMEQKVRRYSRVLVLQTIQKLRDWTDPAQIRRARKRHNDMTLAFAKGMEEQGEKGMKIMAGPCSLCETCGRSQGIPCRFPGQLASCFSAYCICAEKMAESCQMPYWCGENTVAFFSMYLPEDTGTPAVPG